MICRTGLPTRLLRKWSRVRSPHSTIICVHELFVLGRVLLMYNKFVFMKIVYTYLLPRIHNTSFTSAYFGNSRDCEL
jgi:hypothetical protein